MEEMFANFEKLKISAFSKLDKLNGSIHNITIGPDSVLNEENKIDTPKKAITKEKDDKKNNELQFNRNFHDQALKEIESKRQEKVEGLIQNHYNKFEEQSRLRENKKKQTCLEKQKIYQENVERKEKEILQSIQECQTSRANQHENLRKHYQDLIQRKLKLEQQFLEAQEQNRMLNNYIETIAKSQQEFRLFYQEIIAIIKSCNASEEYKSFLSEPLKQLKCLSDGMENAVAKCKTYKVDDNDVKFVQNILTEIKQLKNKISDNITKIKIQQNEEKTKKQNAETAIVNTHIINQKDNIFDGALTLTNYISISNFKRYSDIKLFMEQHAELYKQLLIDEKLKQFRFDCKKAVNIPVNSISVVSVEHLKDKYNRLYNLLKGNNVPVGDGYVNASSHPQGIPFCMDLLAKKFVLQGDMIISSSAEMAFCYATIIISLWNEFPNFGKLFLGYLYIQCPYLIPFYIPRTREETDEEYYKNQGYLYNNGQVETQNKFLKRMTGIMRLYFAILISKPKSGQQQNPHNIKHAWRWFSCILKLQPKLDITATALHTFLETVGFELEATYGLMFKKVVDILIKQFMPSLKKIDSGGPVSRLEGLLQNYIHDGYFNKGKGVLSKHFW